MDEKDDIGPTGSYPEGKLNNDDKGALKLGIAVYEGKIIINFGIPVEWIGMNPKEAIQFAKTIIVKANEVNNGI